jgi:hypothetical protein
MFKRNQVEEAIAVVLEPGAAKLSSETRTRLKRLLETDRNLGRSKRSADPERANFAFHSMDAPGRGLENWFSGYDIRGQARPGDLAVNTTDPVYLVMNSRDQKDRSSPNPAAICRSQAELMRFIKASGPGQTWTVTELGTSINALSLALAKTAPRKRGRGSH